METRFYSNKTSHSQKFAVFSKILSYLKKTLVFGILFIASFPSFALETYFSGEDLKERGQCLGISLNENSAIKSLLTLPTTGPVSLNWASYYGEAINNVFNDIVIDNNGNLYAFGSSVNQGFDAVLAKFDADGALLWSRFLGGTDADNNNPDDTKDYGKITLDQAGNVYVTGITNSSDFPILNAFQATKAGGIDAFIAKYDSDGTLLMSSYLGGSADEQTLGGGGIAVDQSGTIFIGGNTLSTAFFTTTGAYQGSYSGGTEPDVFIVRVSADFSTVTGTFWGDTSEDVLKDLEIDSNGNVWMIGSSKDSDLTLNGQQTTALGDRDGLILKFDNDLSQLDYGSFYGGQFDESIEALTLDATNNIYICGNTFSTNDFPILNPFQNFYQGGEEGFVAKLDEDGAILWCTFLGGTQNEKINAISTDGSNNVYITGSTSSDDFPISRTVQETYNTINCEQDAFVFKFNANGSRDWATYYGGFRREDPKGIIVNTNDQVFIVGKTESTDLPVSPDAYKTSPSFAGVNGFIASFEIACPSIPILIHSTENGRYHDQFWCSHYESDRKHFFSEDSCAVQLIGPPGYSNYSWLKNDAPVSGASGRYYTIPDPSSQGADFRVVVNDGNTCTDQSTSIPDNVSWVRPMCGFGSSFDENELPHFSDILEGYTNEIYCQGASINFDLNTDGFCGANFQWQKDFEDIPGATSSNYSVTNSGCYRIAIQNSFTGCTVFSQTKKFIMLDSVILNDYTLPYAEACLQNDTVIGCASVRLRARVPHCASCSESIPGLTYSWFKDGAPFSSSNTYGYLSTTEDGRYHVEVDNGSCTIVSNFVEVRIQPTEPPVWTFPTNAPVCLKDLDSLILGITHPDANDSALIRFDLPYPSNDISGYDSTVVNYNPDMGCARVRLTTKEGCASWSEYVEFHDTLTPQIQISGPSCIPVYLRTETISSCHLDSVFWYFGDSLLIAQGYDAQHYATIPGPYILRIKNACGDFYSDTINLTGSLEPPTISPTGPICLPANLTTDFPNPDSNIIIHWYTHPTYSSCYPNPNYLIPNENENTLIAGLPGYYFAVLEDTVSGCKSTCSDIVEIQNSVAGAGLSPSNDIYFCDGATVENVTLNVTPSSPSFTYQWYRNNDMILGANSGSYTTNQEGVYRAFVENSCDNSFTPVVSIFSVNNPELFIDQADTVFICGLDSITLTSTADQPLLYQWFKDGVELSEKEDSILNLIDPGLYQVFGLNNSTQCSDFSQEVLVLEGPIINVDFSVTPSCSNTCSGTLNATVTGGIPFSNGSYQLAWSNGAITDSISGLCEGPYTLTVTDFSGCSTSFTEQVRAGFSIALTLDSISCGGANDASISVVTTGGVGPFNYSWNNGSFGNTIQSLGPGTYEVTVSDTQGCNQSKNIVVPPIAALTADLTATEVSCFGNEDAEIQAVISGGSEPYQLNWNSNVVLDSAMLLAGLYQLTVSDQKGCTLEESIDVFEPNELLGEISIIDSLKCFGDASAQLEVVPSGGVEPYSYLWNTSETNAIITNLNAGIYEVTVMDARSCSFTTDLSIAEITTLEVTLDSIENVNCYGDTNGAISILSTGGTPPYTYLWNSGQTNAQISNLSIGDYELTVTDANNCTQIFHQTISQYDLLSMQLTTEDVKCNGSEDGIITVSTSGGNPPYIQNWDQGVDLNVLSAGWYHLTITDQNTCELIDSVEIKEPDLLAFNIEITDSLKCFGDATANIEILPAGGVAPYTYLWNTTETSSVLEDLNAGIYEVTVTDSNNCFLTTAISIAEVPVLELVVDTLENVNCFGGADASISVISMGGIPPYTYLWNTGETSPSISNLTIGIYELTVTDASNCTEVLLQDISEYDLLTLELNTHDVSCNGGVDGMIEVTIDGGNPPYAQTWGQGVNLDMLSAGWYYVTITDQNTCELIDSVQIQEPTLLELSFEIIDSLNCFEDEIGSIDVFVEGGVEPYNYSWSSGQDVSSINELGAGWYILTVSDGNACFDVIDIEIPAIPELVLEVVTINAVSCWAALDGNIQVMATGGTGETGDYEFVLNNTTQNIEGIFNNLETGMYSIFVRDENNCESIPMEFLIETPELLSAEVSTTEVICPGSPTGSAMLNITGGTAPYQYQWSNNLVVASSNSLLAGTYSVTVVDDHNCTTSIEFEIGTPETMVTTIEVIDVTCFGALDGMIEIIGTEGGTGPYNYFLNDAPLNEDMLSFENLHGGFFELETIDANDCSIIETLEIQMPVEMFVDLGEDLNLIFGESYLMEPFIEGGVEPFIYSWSPTRYLDCEDNVDLELCDQTMINIPENTLTYELMITDAAGCTASDEILVRVTRNKPQIFMPNIFTPNADGQNDFFYVQSHNQITEIESFRVYNRWGGLVFQKTNFPPNLESLGWNGILQGQKAPVGTYVYVILYKNIGNESSALSGEVTLIR